VGLRHAASRHIADEESSPPLGAGEAGIDGLQSQVQPAAEPVALDPERQALARRYARQRQVLMLVNLAISGVLVAVLLFSGLSFLLRDVLVGALGAASAWAPLSWAADWQPLLVAAYFGVLFVALFVVDLPLSYYSGFVLPHRYGLATQKLPGWIFDLVKGLVLALVFELAAVEFIYLLLAVSPDLWWLWTSLAVLFVSVILANLAPVLLLPLFYKLTPLSDGDVRRRVLELAARAHTRVHGIYTMHLSAKTTQANAAMMGLGNTRRIVIGDTLLDHYTPDEIEVVLAHELGHQVHRDIPKLVAVQTVTTLGGFYLANVVLQAVLAAVPQYHGLTDVATMPLLGTVLGVFGLLILPIVNGFSRHVEHQADVYALQLTGKVDAFISAMTRMANQNLAELRPSPIIEFLLYDHPSTGRRIAFGHKWVQRHGGQGGAG
jgi:STE24 endopeptidase